MPSGLDLQLLGPFQATLDGKPLTGFPTKGVQALLIYLACQPEGHRREALMAMLWPEMLQKSAQSNLRQTLYLLRRAIPEVTSKRDGDAVPLVLSDRHMVQLNPDADLELDVQSFERMLKGPPEAWPEAADLYRGDFLADFYLPDSSPFEEWVDARRADLRRQLLDTLDSLASDGLREGDLERAEGYARHQLSFDDLRESAHRQLMEAVARQGRRSEALAQYETCRQLLEEELGVAPTAETEALVKAIRSGEFEVVVGESTVASRQRITHLPAFLEEKAGRDDADQPVFVARERELAQLDAHLEAALSGHGRVVFISGEAGQGKTALLRQFTHRSQGAHNGLIVASGNCNAYAGVGDPYLPFREVMAMLSGDVEARWAARTITRDQAVRLWHLLPLTSQALVKDGPDVLDVFVSGSAILERATMIAAAGAEWLEQLHDLIRSRQTRTIDLEQRYLFDQYTNVLIKLAAQHPLLITLDDLQWADAASTSLLFHLGRRLQGNRILIVAAYRPVEVALGLDGERHPLDKLLSELKRTFGDAWVRLTDAEEIEGQGFVDVLLDAEANRLGGGFRQALFRKTNGHPLFTVELLRAMKARGELVQNEQGHWVEGPELDWQLLPARVEAVIEERIGRLEAEQRQILAVASVEGETFTAEVVAQVQGIGLRQLLGHLSHELEKRHRLVREREEVRTGQHSLSRYQFSHILFQRYLYDTLGAGERRLLHGEIAQALEVLYEGQTGEIAHQLAHHFLKAGEREKAIEYAHQAAQRAKALYANEEAIQHLQTALDLLDTSGKVETQMGLLEELADVHAVLVKDTQAISYYQAALELWSSLTGPDDVIAVRLHRKIVETAFSLRWNVDFDELNAWSQTVAISRAFLESRLPMANRELSQLEKVRVLTALAKDSDTGVRSPSDLDEAEGYARTAVDLAERLNAPEEMSDALETLAGICFVRGLLPEQLKASRRRLALSGDPRFGNQRKRSYILESHSDALMAVGKYAQALHYLLEYESMAIQMGIIVSQVWAMGLQALCQLRLDRWDLVLGLEEQRRDLEQRYSGEQLGGGNCVIFAISGAARALRGDLDQARVLREQAYAIMVRSAGGTADNWIRSQFY